MIGQKLKNRIKFDMKNSYAFIFITLLGAQVVHAQTLTNALLPSLCKKQTEECVEIYCELANQMLEEGSYTEAKQYLDTALQVVEANRFDTLSDRYAMLLSCYGIYFQSTSNNFKAIEYFKKVLTIDIQLSKINPDFDLTYLASDYQNIASLLSENGDYTTAVEYYHKALQYLPTTHIDKATILNNMALDFHKNNQLDSALNYYNYSNIILKKLPNNQEVRKIWLTYYFNLATFWNLNRNYKNSIETLQLARAKIEDKDKEHLSYFYNVLGGTVYYQGNINLAKKHLFKALDLRLAKWGKKHVAVANSYKTIGKTLYEDQNNVQTALLYYQKAIAALVLDFDEDTDYQCNPTLNHTILDRYGLLHVLGLKAGALKKLEEFDLAWQTYQLAILLLDDLRLNYQTEGSKFQIMEKAIPIYEKAIVLALQLNDKKTAFQLAERSKATLLLENLNQIQAKQFAGVSATWLQKELDLKIKISEAERKLQEAIKKNQVAAIPPERDNLFQARLNFQVFQKELELEYPEYFHLKYDIQYPNLQTIQNQLLDEDTALLEFFSGDSTIFIFSITKDNFDVHTFPRNDIQDENLLTLKNLLTNPTSNRSSFLGFTSCAHAIYKTYLAPVFDKCKTPIHRLLIIPDGHFSGIPFQTLLKYPTDSLSYKEPRFDTLSYLVYNYTVAYAYSATLECAQRSKAIKSIGTKLKTWAGFAPVFTDNNELRYSQNEVTQIQKLTNGNVFLTTQADLNTFKTQANKYRILHLSTHATADNLYPMLSKIYFYDRDLTIAEIYNIPLAAQLVVLSACETGTGVTRRGEGIFSLARAFMYVGCSSLVASLWKIDEHKSSVQMQNFYVYLYKGYSKSESLQQSQINHLQHIAAKHEAHPFYWAAFLLIGNDSPISRSWYQRCTNFFHKLQA